MAMTLDGTSGITQMTGSIVMSGSTSGTTTIIPSAVAGTTTVTMPAATGTMMVSGNMPAFSAQRATSDQSVTASTWTKIQYNSETFDTANCYDPTTNYRFTPNVAGYYQISASVALNATASYVYISIYKNGSSLITTPYNGANGVGGVAVGLISMNGTTDYLEGYVLKDGTGQVAASAGYNVFQGVLIRSA